MSAVKVELGRYLFYDGRMSVNGKESCGTCPSSGTCIHRWPQPRPRYYRPTSSAWQHEPGERGLRSVLDLGESNHYIARGPSAGSDAERRANRVGPEMARGGVSRSRAPRSCLSTTVSGSVSRRERSVHNPECDKSDRGV